MRAATIRALFGPARPLVPLAEAIARNRPPMTPACTSTTRSGNGPLVGRGQALRLRLHRGRLDKTHHPFMTKFSLGDVRITTRVDEDILGERCSARSTNRAMPCTSRASAWLRRHAAAGGTSAGVHESQSRLWENIVGRSRASGSTSTPSCRRLSPSSSATYRWTPSIAPSTRWSGR